MCVKVEGMTDNEAVAMDDVGVMARHSSVVSSNRVRVDISVSQCCRSEVKVAVVDHFYT